MKKDEVNLFEIETELLNQGFTRIMGLDEVGRGCLAGPVVAAGVILDPQNIPDGINDSKKLSDSKRRLLSRKITQSALFYTIQECSPSEIDKLNILRASLTAMERCAGDRGADPDFLLIDGNRYLPTLLPHQCVVKGDSRSLSIAAASILAKVYRDDVMTGLHQEFPHYNWKKNVGYPTRDHYEGLRSRGASPHHRMSFNLKI